MRKVRHSLGTETKGEQGGEQGECGFHFKTVSKSVATRVSACFRKKSVKRANNRRNFLHEPH
jgi:hypothetical protein